MMNGREALFAFYFFILHSALIIPHLQYLQSAGERGRSCKRWISKILLMFSISIIIAIIDKNKEFRIIKAWQIPLRVNRLPLQM